MPSKESRFFLGTLFAPEGVSARGNDAVRAWYAQRVAEARARVDNGALLPRGGGRD